MTYSLPEFDQSTILGLHEAAKVLARSKRSDSEKELLEHIVEQQRDERTLKALYWNAIRRFDLREAAQLLKEIEQYVGGSAKKKAWMAKASSGPLEGVALIERFQDARGTTPFTPEPGRLLYVLHNSLPYSSGGYATRAQGMAIALRAAGLDVVCVSRPGFPLDIPGDHDGKEINPVDMVDGIPYHRVTKPQRTGKSAVAYMSQSAEALKEEIVRHRPSCVIAASNHLTAIPACLAARSLGIPFVYEVRGFWEVTRLSREPEFVDSTFFKMQMFFETNVAKEADHVLTLTSPMRQELIDRGVDPEKVTLAPNSCDPSQFSPRPRDPDLAARLGIPDDVPVIGYIGSFVQYEGLEHLVEAGVQLRDRGYDFRLMLVGSENASGNDRGPITEKILRIAEEAGLGDRLIMPGRVPHEQVDAYYSLIDIAPFPRKPQPVTEMVSPMKPLEAFAMEKAVVVSSVKALNEMVQHEQTGLVFEKGNITAMADTLARLIEDPALRTRLGKAGRIWVEKERTWQRTAERALADLAARNVTFDGEAKQQQRVPAAKALDHEGTSPTTRQTRADGVPKPASFAADMYTDNKGVPKMPKSQAAVYDRVKAKFDARDEKAGKVSFSRHDWLRTKTAFALFGKARYVIDIGIGQGQLVNMFCENAHTKKVVGVDRTRNTKLLQPRSDKYEFVSLDITRPFPTDMALSDVTFAMEIFEHIDVDKVKGAIGRARLSSRFGMLFASVPYKEEHPLYHHDKPFGHKQSFDDVKVRECFGEDAIWTNFNDLWYLVFAAEGLEARGSMGIEGFAKLTRTAFEAQAATESALIHA